jgi:hypothetical protein
VNARAFDCLAARLPRPDDMKPEAYRRNLAARAFDVARYLLFWGIPTNVGQVTSIRTSRKADPAIEGVGIPGIARRGRRDRASLRRRAGLRVGCECRAPRLWRPRWRAMPKPMNMRARAAGLRRLGRIRTLPRYGGGEPPRVDLVRPTDTAADIVATLLYPVTDRPFRELYEMARGWSAARRAEVLDVAIESRTRRDDLLAGFHGGLYAYDFAIDIGAYRDLHRHRRCHKFRQSYSGRLGFDTPPLVEEAGATAVYREAMESALSAMHGLPAPGARITCCPSARAGASCSRWISPRPNTSRACAAA